MDHRIFAAIPTSLLPGFVPRYTQAYVARLFLAYSVVARIKSNSLRMCSLYSLLRDADTIEDVRHTAPSSADQLKRS